MRRVIAIALAICVSGCGLTMTTGPGTPVPGQRPVCTESMAAPTRDAIPAGIGFFSILVGLLFLKGGDNETVGVPLIIGGGATMAGAYISGGIGYFRVKKCRKAIAEFEGRPPP
jgi:hypothetical protein